MAKASFDDSATATLIWNALPIEAKGGAHAIQSLPNEIRPDSPVNVIGKVAGDAGVFKKVRSGRKVRRERA